MICLKKKAKEKIIDILEGRSRRNLFFEILHRRVVYTYKSMPVLFIY